MDTNKKRANKAPKKQRSLAYKILLGILLFAASAIVVVVALGFFLLGRIQAPGAFVFEQEPTPLQEPAPTASIPPALEQADNQQQEATEQQEENTPAFEGEPEIVADEPLPLEDLYPQTRLSAAQQAAMAAQNENKQAYVNILVVGVDRRGTQGRANADVVMIGTLDKKNGRLKLTSLLRDLYVPIPGFENARLNSAAAKGGMPLLMHTVNEALQLDIENYVLVDFSMFEKIINKLGGVTVHMSAAEISAANDNIAGLNKQRGVSYLWDGFIFANPGNVQLNGKQALGYVRIRKIDSDFGRTNRQFQLLNAVFAKFKGKNAIEQYDLIVDVLSNVETDLSAAQLIEYGVAALSLDTGGLMHQTVPMEGLYQNGKVNRSFVFLFDMPATAWQVHRFIYLDTSEPKKAQVLSPGASLPPRTPGLTPTPSPTPFIPMEPEAPFVIPEEDIVTAP